MTNRMPIRRTTPAALTAFLALLAAPETAPAQFVAPGLYGAAANYGYYGGPGPYGWGPYSFGWAGFTTAGVRPPLRPPGTVPEPDEIAITAAAASPPTAADVLRQQAKAASWRDRRREALQMEAKFDVTTGLPRDVPARVAPPIPLDRRLAALFTDDGSIAWPVGLDTASPAARGVVEQAARLAVDQYRREGRARVADVTLARQALAEFASPIFSRLAATDDPLSYQAALSFFQQLDSTLIDLADPPAPAAAAMGPDARPQGGP